MTTALDLWSREFLLQVADRIETIESGGGNPGLPRPWRGEVRRAFRFVAPQRSLAGASSAVATVTAA